MNVINYRSSAYNILKNIYGAVSPDFQKLNSDVYFLEIFLLKKFFSDFYFLFFYPEKIDFNFLKYFSFFTPKKNVNSIFTDSEYFDDFILFYEIKKSENRDNSITLFSGENEIIPFAKNSDVIPVSFKTYITETIPIFYFLNAGASNSFEISFILFFSKILNNRNFVKKINSIFHIFMDEKIKNFQFDIAGNIDYEKLLDCVKLIYSESIPNVVSDYFSGIEISEEFFFEFLVNLIYSSVKLFAVLNVRNYEIYNLDEILKQEIINSNEIVSLLSKIEKYLKYDFDFWKFHKLAYYTFVSNNTSTIKQKLISVINSKFLNFEKSEIFIEFSNLQIGRNFLKNIFKNSVIYFLFKYFLKSQIFENMYVRNGAEDLYFNEDVSSRIYLIYTWWNEFIFKIDVLFDEEPDYLSDVIDELHTFLSGVLENFINSINEKSVPMYPLLNPTSFSYKLDKFFDSGLYAYIMNNLLFGTG